MSIRSKIIAITGGSQGLGKAMARALCSEGARVAIIGRDAKKLLQVSRDITGDISTFPCDIGDPKAVQETFNAINTELGGLDVLINNAAIYPPFKLENGSDDQICYRNEHSRQPIPLPRSHTSTEEKPGRHYQYFI